MDFGVFFTMVANVGVGSPKAWTTYLTTIFLKNHWSPSS
jgi:hypothetical protein